MLIERDISEELQTLVNEYRVVTILGPRQAGKTTLAKTVLKDYIYSNLEDPETRHLAETDPKAYLAELNGKVIIDEIQRVPHLLSYIQVVVDESEIMGQFVLTGSHQLSLREAITQSLAGRTAILHLLPLSIHELEKAKLGFDSMEEYCFTGFMPGIYAQSQRPTTAYANYYQTYVERDVRQLIHLKDASLFEKFLKLIAGRIGQVFDYSSLANDVGVNAKTIRHWISILEASFIIFKLPPYFENFGKRVIKSPKYYFTDVGLLCFLLGIRAPEQIRRDPLLGQIFENLIVIECLKTRYNLGVPPDLYYFRDSKGNEVDLLIQSERQLQAVEIKSASTFHSDQLKGLRLFAKITDSLAASWLIYTGDKHSLSNTTTALNYTDVRSIFCESLHKSHPRTQSMRR
ncbi:MAG: ATP-binding protein [Verrucomicrobiales bacterium]|nr:ATP-binding protein [Verrucomicrobiales bacterium]